MTTGLKHITVLLACLAGLQGSAVLAQSDSNTVLTVYAGATTFPDPSYDSLTLVELPFSLSRNEFEFYRPDGPDSSLYASIFAQAVLINTFGQRIDSASTSFSVRTSTRAEAMQEGIRLFNKLQLLVPPGIYSARVEVIDVTSERTGEALVDKIIVVPPTKGHLSLADPVLAYRITPESSDSTVPRSRLARNGFVITPNPVSMFSTTDTIIYIYAEMYNLASGDDASEVVNLTVDILRDDVVFRPLGMRNIVKPGNTVALAETFDIKGWTTGLYAVRMIANDPGNFQADTSQTLFRIISSREIAAAVKEFKSDDPFKGMTLQEKLNVVFYFLTDPERETLKRLSDLGKQSFLDQFWKEHPSVRNPYIDVSHTAEDLVIYYRHANRFFSENEKKEDGWRTDRGRILMMYGPWEQIIERLVSLGPYDVWTYHSLEAGIAFVFVNELESYRLVHSNVRGEIWSDDWAAVLQSSEFNTEPDLTPSIDGP